MMETKTFIEKTNYIVKLLMRVTDEYDYSTLASITTAQAEMDCDTLLKHCDIVTDIIKKSKAELMRLKKQINQNKTAKDFKSTWEWIDTFEDGTPEWREAMDICQKYYKKYNVNDPIEYLDQIIEEHNKLKERIHRKK